MGARAFVLGVVVWCAGVSAASATVRITDDQGGRMGVYLRTFAMLRSSGEAVIIDGPCLSACTLILGILPIRQVCVTPRASLGFHAAWQPDERGRPIPSTLGTRALMANYPPKVRSWIRRRGGLSRQMIYMHGRELSSIYPRCRAAR